MTAFVPGVGVLTAIALAACAACNERFDFDVPPSETVAAADTSGDTVTNTTGSGDIGSDAGTPGRGCLADADCQLASLHCHPASNECVECLDNQDCTADGAAYCDPERFRCVGCTQDDHCMTNARCDVIERRCVPSCATLQDCADAHACKNGLCVACDRDVECREDDAGGPVCSASGLGCVSCREDAQCPAPEICDVLSGRCVTCLSSADCPDDTFCEPTLLECVAG